MEIILCADGGDKRKFETKCPAIWHINDSFVCHFFRSCNWRCLLKRCRHVTLHSACVRILPNTKQSGTVVYPFCPAKYQSWRAFADIVIGAGSAQSFVMATNSRNREKNIHIYHGSDVCSSLLMRANNDLLPLVCYTSAHSVCMKTKNTLDSAILCLKNTFCCCFRRITLYIIK